MMKIEDWLRFFKEHNDMKVFHFNHLKLFSRMGNHSLRVALQRLSKKGVIKRVCRGYYANPFSVPGVEEVSSQIYTPSYISLESALSKSAILSQIPQILTCVTTNLPRVFKTPFGVIEYRQVKKPYFWGFYKEDNYFMAEPEKAILDFIYLRGKKNIEGTLSEFDLSGISHKKLKAYAKKMNLRL